MLLSAARTTEVTETPPFVRKVRSSAARTAFCIVGGISDSGFQKRVWAENRPISLPFVSFTTVVWKVASAFCSVGRVVRKYFTRTAAHAAAITIRKSDSTRRQEGIHRVQPRRERRG